MIIVKKSAFSRIIEWKNFEKRLSKDVEDSLNAASRSCFLVVDNTILIGLHLSSKSAENLP